jgi:hypothetical protein
MVAVSQFAASNQFPVPELIQIGAADAGAPRPVSAMAQAQASLRRLGLAGVRRDDCEMAIARLMLRSPRNAATSIETTDTPPTACCASGVGNTRAKNDFTLARKGIAVPARFGDRTS